MKIKALETFKVSLPFRFSFAHHLAKRSCTINLLVRATLTDGTQGFGEGVPREYVTGEDIDVAEQSVKVLYAPSLCLLDVSDLNHVLATLEHTFLDLGLNKKAKGASWCATEIAILDAVARAHKISVAEWLGPVKTPKIRYGGVVPFGGMNTLRALLVFYKLYGLKTVKLKVGNSLEENVAKVRMARQIMGPDAILRLDANCAWTAEQAIAHAEAMRPWRIASIEQPVAALDLAGLAKVKAAIEEEIVVDESLCTIADAETLAREKLCGAFNIRLSKVGGFLTAAKMVALADKSQLGVHLGAQVGESGILTAAARVFAAVNKPFKNYEGSANMLLLEQDLVRQNLTARAGGWGDLFYGLSRLPEDGFGVTVVNKRIKKLSYKIDNECDLARQVTG